MARDIRTREPQALKTVFAWERRSYGYSANFARGTTIVKLRVHTLGMHISWSANKAGLHGGPALTPGLVAVIGNAKRIVDAKRTAEEWGHRLFKGEKP